MERTDERSFSFSIRKRSLRMIIVSAVVAAVAFPAGVVFASHTFDDVPESNVHHDAITAVADAGITVGCATGGYCPSDAVTRAQMASFIDRLGALSGQEPSVNATTVDGANAVDLRSIVVSDSFASVSALPTTVTNLGSVTIDVPVDGTLVAHGHVTLVTFGEGTVTTVGITDSDDAEPDAGAAGTSRVGFLDGAATTRRVVEASPQRTLEVEAGTHTLYLNAQKSATFDAQEVNATSSLLTVTFVPAG
jgi:hypothetical protein